MNKTCAIIPTYNHHVSLPEIVTRLLSANLPVFIIDDGSNVTTQHALQQLQVTYPTIHILHLPQNSGKGGAIQAGIKWVARLGYSHALQVDADGQHCLDTLEDFLMLANNNPQALISGRPVYDASVPRARRIARWLTHIWIFIETLSLRIRDSMCGLRIYPIEATLNSINQYRVGCRMEFDPEIMVRLFWQGTPVIMHPVQVSYPTDNISHFDVIADNWRITKMHTRLFFLMLLHLPHILRNRPNYKNLKLPAKSILWSTLEERGTLLGLWILVSCYRLVGRHICFIIGAPIVLYFYITGTVQRHASQLFLQRVWAWKKSSASDVPAWMLGSRSHECESFASCRRKLLSHPPNWINGLRHFMSFYAMTLDKFAAWTNRMQASQIEPSSLANFSKMMIPGQGGMLLVSHLGNMEFCRAVACADHKQRMHVLWHSKNTQRFNRMLKFFNPNSNVNMIEVMDIGPDTMIYLKERIEQGDWVVIAGDRVPVSDSTHIVNVSFLGKQASFSQGPYILAALLQCSVYTAVAVRVGKQFKVYLELFAQSVTLERKNRLQSIQQYAQQYATRLESYCVMYPYQWFNFFDFWRST